MHDYAGKIFLTIIIRTNKPGNKLFYIQMHILQTGNVFDKKSVNIFFQFLERFNAFPIYLCI